MGYRTAEEAVIAAGFGEGPGKIVLDDVECTGYEPNIAYCSYNVKHKCRHHEDAGVRCTNDIAGLV